MLKEQVPQDKNSYGESNLTTVVYALDTDGKYVAVQCTGWEPENLAQKQAWDAINEKTELIKNAVIEGKLSPLVYYMAKNQFSIKRLSHLTGISRRTIKMQGNPKKFDSINPATAEIYAAIFRVSITELKNPWKIPAD